jgi:DnaK suppressor protein
VGESNPELDQEFIRQQKQKLLDMRDELTRMNRGLEGDEQERAEEERENLSDRGDMSQHIFNREMDATVGRRLERRLETIERALEKIEEGTYGVCDESGEPIPKGRLEAVPEAIHTVEVQQRMEG